MKSGKLKNDTDKSKKELIKELNNQRLKTNELEKIKYELERVEEEKNVILESLKERVKELNCLYDISKINETPKIGFEELFQKIVETIPLGWKYPKNACARITIEKKEFKTENFQETKWKLGSPISYDNKYIGKVEVFYLKEMPELEEGPFFEGEKKLIFAIGEKLEHIIEKKYSERALKESEEKFRILFDNASDSIFIHDLNGKFVETNQIASNLLEYEKLEILSMEIKDIFPSEYISAINKMFEELKRSGYYYFETEIMAKKCKLIPVEICSKIIELKKKKVILSIVRDITERKLSEEKIKRQLMKFSIEFGKLYLIKEQKSLLSIEAFNDLLKVGYSGHILTRSLESEYRELINGSYKYIWISENNERYSLFPDFKKIEDYLNNIPRKSFVLIDRIDYILTKNGFSKFLSFIYSLREIAYLRGITIMISADPELFSKFELRLMEKETSEITPIKKEKLSESLVELLRFVYNKNLIGIKPTFSEIGRELNITRPTVGKRMGQLTSLNYLSVSIKGRNKIVELTNKGKEFFSK